jgi:hypothetical protein
VTCGQDGKAFYWVLSGKDNIVFDYYCREFKFNGVAIYTLDNDNKFLLLLDENKLIEVPVNKEPINNFMKVEKKEPKALFKDDHFSQIIFDQYSSLLILASLKEHSPAIRMVKYLQGVDLKEYYYQANALGIKTLKASYDMSHIFSGGKDKCVFIFQTNVSKSDKREDNFDDLTLVKKDDLQKQAQDLKQQLNKINVEMYLEEERLSKLKRETETHKTTFDERMREEKDKFNKEVTELEEQISERRDYFEYELDKENEDYTGKMEKLDIDHLTDLEAMNSEKQREFENRDKIKNDDSRQTLGVTKKITEELKRIEDEYETKINGLDTDIRTLEDNKSNLMFDVERWKERCIEENDDKISFKRAELEKLRTGYETIDKRFSDEKSKLQSQINQNNAIILNKNTLKADNKGKLIILQQENDKLIKLIAELREDKSEKEKTIEEKNRIKKELEKENQELEKFKFVLNYKIKELKEDKEPKEIKYQKLEKRAKDMDKVINPLTL